MFSEKDPGPHDDSVKFWESTDTGGHHKSKELASEEPQGKQQGWFVTRILL